MPIYEYLCEKCGQEMETVQKITDPPLAMHADCGGNLKKLISSSAFVLKGTGWYVTDYPSQSRKDAMSAGEKAGGTAKTKPAGDTASTTPAPATTAPTAPAAAPAASTTV